MKFIPFLQRRSESSWSPFNTRERILRPPPLAPCQQTPSLQNCENYILLEQPQLRQLQNTSTKSSSVTKEKNDIEPSLRAIKDETRKDSGEILVVTRQGSVIRDGRNLKHQERSQRANQSDSQWESKYRKLLKSDLGKHQIRSQTVEYFEDKLPEAR